MAPTFVQAVSSLLALSLHLSVSNASPTSHILQKRYDIPSDLPENWEYQGCYVDGVGARTLNGPGYASYTDMSAAECIAFCDQRGYKYAGTEYSHECFCGNTLTVEPVPDADCNMECSAGNGEACGGPNRLSVYVDTGATGGGPVVREKVGLWDHLGCYTDNVDGVRTLSVGTGVPGEMTVEKCTTACANGGYILAGVEYGGECYCGNDFSGDNTLAPDGNAGCNMPCNGDMFALCGGPNRLNVYGYDGAFPVPSGTASPPPPPPPSSTASPTTSSVAAPPSSTVADPAPTTSPRAVQPSVAAGWSYTGCYTDSVAARALPVGGIVTGGMTIEKCQASCRSQGYTLAGLEYMWECFCGNAVQNGHGPAPNGETGCNMACQGDAEQICGGADRLSLYTYSEGPPPDTTTTTPTDPDPTSTEEPEDPTSTDTDPDPTSTEDPEDPTTTTVDPQPTSTGWNTLGCYVDGVGARALAYGGIVDGPMTVEKCQAACRNQGYIYAGVEYAAECYCDNSIKNNRGPAPDGNVGCNMPCNGNPEQMCGGANRINIFVFGIPPTSTTTTTTTPPPTSTEEPEDPEDPTSTTTTEEPTSTIDPNEWSYRGCFVDNANGRIMARQLPDDPQLTPEKCVNACANLGYTVAGVQYGVQCFCDDYIRNGGVQAPESDCSFNCPGDATKKCGAGSRNSVYAIGELVLLDVPAAQTEDLPGSWKYEGCIVDPPDRVFIYQSILQKNNTAENCLGLCQKFGYTAGGMEYGEECFCGDKRDTWERGSSPAPEAECNIVCSGDPRYICGGGARLSWYSWDDEPIAKWTYAQGDAAGEYKMLVPGVVVPLIATMGVNGKVQFLEKHMTGPENSTGAYEFDPSLENAPFPSMYRTMNVKTDVFCAAGVTLPDKVGRQLNIGGWSGESTFGVRLYWPDGAPGEPSTNNWEENVNVLSLQAGRWYPSAMIMSNGSVLVVGGEEGSNGAPVPSLEILPRPPGGYVKYAEYLERTDPNNLYPFLTVMPSGNIFISYWNEARLLDPVTLDTVRELPNLPGAVNNFLAGRTYPYEGAFAMLPIVFPNPPPVTVIFCGGSTPGIGVGLDNCVSTQPDVPDAEWVIERMPSRRVLSNIVALPDGTYLILNGAKDGVAGFGLALNPNHNAVLYDPAKPINERMTVLANTTIDRMYHSEAILLQDGRVLVSGSDPQDPRFLQEYRIEQFIPPYFKKGIPQPEFTITNKDWAYNEQITIQITARTTNNLKVSLMGAESSTHGYNMGQRTIFPEQSCTATSCTITAPPDNKWCPPGWFMLFLLDDGVPSYAQWVRIGGDPAELGNWPDHPDFTTPGI